MCDGVFFLQYLVYFVPDIYCTTYDHDVSYLVPGMTLLCMTLCRTLLCMALLCIGIVFGIVTRMYRHLCIDFVYRHLCITLCMAMTL